MNEEGKLEARTPPSRDAIRAETPAGSAAGDGLPAVGECACDPSGFCPTCAAGKLPSALPVGKDGMPLRVEVKANHLCLGIGISTLAWAFEHGEGNNPFNEATGNYGQRYRISDPLQFAKDVCHQMNDEGEDGSTPLTRFLDSMMVEAVEQGSLGILDPDDTAPSVPAPDSTEGDGLAGAVPPWRGP